MVINLIYLLIGLLVASREIKRIESEGGTDVPMICIWGVIVCIAWPVVLGVKWYKKRAKKNEE